MLISSISDSTIDASYNWWGHTLNDYTANADLRKVHTTVTNNYWYFLDIIPSPTHLRVNDTSNITFTLNSLYDNGGKRVLTTRLGYYNPITFNISSTLGNLSSKTVTLNSNMFGYAIYNASEVGLGVIKAENEFCTGIYNYMYNVPDDSFVALNITLYKNNQTVLNLTHNYKYYEEYGIKSYRPN